MIIVRVSSQLTDSAVQTEIGARIRRWRLQRNQTQQELADEAGVSKRTVERVEAGDSTQLSSFIRVCRALGLLDRFDGLVPEVLPSPMDALKLQSGQRKRASGRGGEDIDADRSWTWGDEK